MQAAESRISQEILLHVIPFRIITSWLKPKFGS